jgi:release factor glutamine methyltransferase
VHTARLRYRRFGPGDLDLIAALNADPEVMRYLGNGRPMSRDQVRDEELPRLRAYNERPDRLGFWAGFAGAQFVGWFCATPRDDDLNDVEIGYRLARVAWGNGYATEGARLMQRLAFTAGARRTVATTMAVNAGSRGVLAKLGMQHVGTWFGDWAEPIPGSEHGDVNYALDRRGYLIAVLRAAGCVFAEDEADLLLSATTTPTELIELTDRRAAGEPLEQVLGWAQFCGRPVAVRPGVFVPRRRTEFLVEQTAAGLAPHALVVDLCCGSGAVGAALAARAESVDLHAADIDPAAVACAARTVAEFGGHAYHGDLFAALPIELRGRVDVLLANPPYIPSSAIAMLPSEARDHEPAVALDGGEDGLAIVRRIGAEAGDWLAPGGRVLVEVSEAQAPEAAAVFERGGFAVSIARDEDRDATVVVGTTFNSHC